jgi:ferrous iron transport protein A
VSSKPINSLADLEIGDRARVATIVGSDAISQRLMEMGLTPGVEISLLGRALLGDPIEIEVRGYRLSVRRSEAERVELESPR